MSPYEKCNHQGFALVTVLLFLQILTLLGLYALQQSRLTFKMTDNYFQHQLLVNAAESALKIAENSAPVCQKSIMNREELLSQPFSFWQSLPCKGMINGFSYYYITEALGSDACIAILSQAGIANYFRVTVLTTSSHQTIKVLLQTILVKPVYSSEICHGPHHSVSLGRQTWRML